MKRATTDTVYLAPGAASGGAMRLPGHAETEPQPGNAGGRIDPDSHLVEPETSWPEGRWEVVNGERVQASPARAGHGDIHCRLDRLVDVHVNQGYVASTDLLTRHGPRDDFATDTCVRKLGRDETTGHRYLEELSFEVFFTQQGHPAKTNERARTVLASGVRRIFGLFVQELYPDSDNDGEVEVRLKEWSQKHDEWVELAPGDTITDACLQLPLPVQAVMDAIEADNATVMAMKARGNPALAKLERMSEQTGRIAGVKESIAMVLAHRELPLSPHQRQMLDACMDIATLNRWLQRALTIAHADELFAPDED